MPATRTDADTHKITEELIFRLCSPSQSNPPSQPRASDSITFWADNTHWPPGVQHTHWMDAACDRLTLTGSNLQQSPPAAAAAARAGCQCIHTGPGTATGRLALGLPLTQSDGLYGPGGQT